MKTHRRRRRVGNVPHARTHAVVRSNPKRRRRGARRRRANPAPLTTVMLANPRKTHRRRRKVVSVALRRRSNPRRRRLTIGRPHLARRRRSNPSGINRQSLGGALGLVRLGLFGGVGIVVARIAGSLYTQYVAPSVVGTGGETWRQYASEFLRLVAMGAASWGVSRALARMVRPADAQALMIGGLAETGRQAIGVAYKAAGGDAASAKTYGLDGRRGGMGAVQPWIDAQGNVFEWDARRQGWQLAGAVPNDYFAGVEPNQAFAGR